MKKLILATLLAFAAPARATDCGSQLATGTAWAKSERFPLNQVHPGFSTKANSIYYSFDSDGFWLHLEQENMSAAAPRIKRFYLHYDPVNFKRSSYVRLLLGEDALHLDEKQLEGGYMRLFVSDPEGSEVVALHIPRPDGKFSEVLISRSTGKIFGFGAEPKNRIARALRRAWMTFGEFAHARETGRGVWYNSDSNLTPPYFDPKPVVVIPDGLHLGVLGNQEAELIVRGNQATVNVMGPAGEVTWTVTLAGREIKASNGFYILPLPEFESAMTVYPQQLIENGAFANHLMDLKMRKPESLMLSRLRN